MSDYTYQPFPAWFYGPNGEAEIFHGAEQVPAGWVDHPAKLGQKEDAAEPTAQPEAKRRGRPPKAANVTEDEF